MRPGGIGRLLAVYLGENDSHSGLVGTQDGPDAALGKRLQMPKYPPGPLYPLCPFSY